MMSCCKTSSSVCIEDQAVVFFDALELTLFCLFHHPKALLQLILIFPHSHGLYLILWDINTGDILRRFEGHSDRIYAVAFSPDGQTALSASRDGTAILWDVSLYSGGIINWIQANRYVPELTCK